MKISVNSRNFIKYVIRQPSAKGRLIRYTNPKLYNKMIVQSVINKIALAAIDKLQRSGWNLLYLPTGNSYDAARVNVLDKAGQINSLLKTPIKHAYHHLNGLIGRSYSRPVIDNLADAYNLDFYIDIVLSSTDQLQSLWLCNRSELFSSNIIAKLQNQMKIRIRTTGKYVIKSSMRDPKTVNIKQPGNNRIIWIRIPQQASPSAVVKIFADALLIEILASER